MYVLFLKFYCHTAMSFMQLIDSQCFILYSERLLLPFPAIICHKRSVCLTDMVSKRKDVGYRGKPSQLLSLLVFFEQ